MDSNPKKTRKVTIKDVLDVCELASLGIKESTDGTPVNPSWKISEFLCDSGMLEDRECMDIQEKYCGKLGDMEERKKYRLEISAFTNEYYQKKVDEFLNSLSKSGN